MAADTSTPNPAPDRYRDFAALAAEQTEGIDYRISVAPRRHSTVAIIAPHGGSIERRTRAIATALAGDDFNLYVFEGLDEDGSYDVLHITSHRFDEPRCLELIARCDTVVAVHGCGGDTERVLFGGRDTALIERLAGACRGTDVEVLCDNHPFPGTHRSNICNRGRLGQGVQIEFSDALRGGPSEAKVIAALREVLLESQRPAGAAGA